MTTESNLRKYEVTVRPTIHDPDGRVVSANGVSPEDACAKAFDGGGWPFEVQSPRDLVAREVEPI